MNDVTSARLAAWLRFVPDKDGYGIPLFSAGGNHLLMPKTDSRLRIVSFSEFFNEDQFPISYGLPPAATQQLYKLEDKTPIPYIIEGECDIIDPSIGLDELDSILGARSGTETAALLREVLTDAHANLLSAIFVGRHQELQHLIQVWNQVRDQRGSFECVILTGRPGVGKTALVEQFRRFVMRDKKDAPPFVEIQNGRQVFDPETSSRRPPYESSSAGTEDEIGPVITYVSMERLDRSTRLLDLLLEQIGRDWGMLIVEDGRPKCRQAVAEL